LQLREHPHHTEPRRMNLHREREAQYPDRYAPGPMLSSNRHSGYHEHECANREHHQQRADRETRQQHRSSANLPKNGNLRSWLDLLSSQPFMIVAYRDIPAKSAAFSFNCSCQLFANTADLLR
jgi:hypothetical protein